MDVVEPPEYFICPISLQIMKDPVTAVTGITYDRESIEHWLFVGKSATCPVTNQPLTMNLSDLTPNHTLRRLIQTWCNENASRGIDRIPTPKAPLEKFSILNIIQDLQFPELEIKTLRRIESLAVENERNRTLMVEAGIPKAILQYIARCHEKTQTAGLEEALSILQLVRPPPSEAINILVTENNDRIIESLTWILCCEVKNYVFIRSHALIILKRTIRSTSSIFSPERLKPEFFLRIIRVLRSGITQQALNAALQILLFSCPWVRNRSIMVEYGTVFELIELELGFPEKKTSELILGILSHLCSSADGRAKFISHRCGIAVVSKRILSVSPLADARAVLILFSISKFSGTSMVAQELLMVGAVSRLCMLLQAECGTHLKDKAREILRTHNEEWRKFPCMNDRLLARITS